VNWLQLTLGLLLMASLWACGSEGSIEPTVAINLSLVINARQAQNSSIPSRLVAWIHGWLPSANLASAQSVEEISSIQVEITGPGILVPASTTVSVSNPTSGQVIPVRIQAPPGPNRTIVVWALNAATPPRRIFSGMLSGVSLTPGPPVDLEVVLVPIFTVTVQKQGIGSGTITSTPLGIDCGTNCSGDFEQGTMVSFNAATAPRSVFVGWSGGACSGAIPTCTVVINANQTVTATFTIPNTNWTLQFVDSEEPLAFGAAVRGFDGVTETIWHTQFLNGSPPPPHEIQINLGSSANLNGFVYVPRQDGVPNGWIGQYEFYVSTDGVNWGSPVAGGTFANDATNKQVSFAPTTGQYVRLRALSEVNGNPWTTMAELQLLNMTSGAE
jgi:F5/8 type C domain/Divergent InlB B-repeat domain